MAFGVNFGGCTRLPIASVAEQLSAFDEAGAALPKEGLTWLSALLSRTLLVFGAPTPWLYSTSVGGEVQAEWSSKCWEVAARFDLPARSCELMAAHLACNSQRELKLHLDVIGAEFELGLFLKTHGI